MNKIIVNLGNFKLDEIPLHRGSLNIGRADDNDISLADAATSSHHAKIVTIFTSSFIQDLNSTNGTIVNGRKVVRHTLHHGDVISIGNLQLLFKSDAKDVAKGSNNTALVNKDEMKSRMMKSLGLQKDNVDTATTVSETSKNEALSGFSISVASSTDNTVKIPENENSIPESMIPVLEETLPLDELRKNPDRMVVLTPSIKKAEKPPADSKINKKTKIKSPELDVNINQTMLSMESEPTIAFDDEQIKKLLEGDDYQNDNARMLAKLAFGIILLVVVAISIYLLI